MRTAPPLRLLLLALAACAEAGDVARAPVADTTAPLPTWEPPLDGAVVELAGEPLVSDGSARVAVLRTLRGTDQYPLAGPADVELLADGRVLVLDAVAQDVKLFDADGALERVLGRDGGGPGELGRGATNLFVAPPDTVLVVDAWQGRVVRWTLGGEPGPTSRLAVHDGAPLGYRWRASDRRLLQAFVPVLGGGDGRTRYDVAFLVRPALQRDTASMLELPTGADTTVEIGHSSHDAELHWAVGDDGRVLAAWGGAYQVRVFEEDGMPRQLLRRDAPRAAIGDDEADALRRLVLRSLTSVAAADQARALATMRDGYRFPSHYPALAGLAAGPDGETWVQRTATVADVEAGRFAGDVLSGRSTTWDVYDRDGRYLAAVRLPDGFTLTRIAGRTLVGHAMDDAGEPVARLLRLDLPAP